MKNPIYAVICSDGSAENIANQGFPVTWEFICRWVKAKAEGVSGSVPRQLFRDGRLVCADIYDLVQKRYDRKRELDRITDKTLDAEFPEPWESSDAE